jgi:hypothetical protein
MSEHLFDPAPYTRDESSPCMDCGVPTTPGLEPDRRPIVGTWEWYMVHDHIWRAARAPDKGFLCIGCLEQRLGRALNRADFPSFEVNGPRSLASPRLRARRGV